MNKGIKSAIKRGKRGFLHLIMGRTGIICLFLIIDIILLLSGYFWLDRYFELIFSGSTILMFIMLVYIFNTDYQPTVKLTWCFIIAIAPLFGMFLHLYIKLDIGHRSEQKRCAATVKETNLFRPDSHKLLESMRDTEPDFYGIAYYIESTGSDLYAGTDTRYFPIGESMYASILEELEKAEKFIFLEYFIIDEGIMWNSILEILKRKVKSGIEVRVMYDGTCAFTKVPYSYFETLCNMGIKSKMFAPFRPFATTSYNNRDHRKILIIDGKLAYTGGINLADEYINECELFGHWKDNGILIRGEAVRGFTLMFLQLWNESERNREYEKYLPAASECTVRSEGYVIPYGDSPLDDERVGENVYLNILASAKRYVHIMTPYLIIDDEMMSALKFAAKRGVDVKIILPHIPDKKYAYALARTHYVELICAGVHIYEYTPGFVHGKVMTADGIHAIVGTINLDYRSLYHHFECAVYLYKTPEIDKVERDMLDTEGISHEITLQEAEHTGLPMKIAGAILKLFAPLL